MASRSSKSSFPRGPSGRTRLGRGQGAVPAGSQPSVGLPFPPMPTACDALRPAWHLSRARLRRPQQVKCVLSGSPAPILGPRRGGDTGHSRPEPSLNRPRARTLVWGAMSSPPPLGKLKQMPLPSLEAPRALCNSPCPCIFKVNLQTDVFICFVCVLG